ncbi:MAG: RNA polymerase sigma factor [Planctomycetes bacterium]|nr:RNA polymerase sigma factor [Planctomycetota bacterium]
MQATNQELVRDASQGDSAAVGVLLERHLPGLLAYVRAHAGRQLLQRDASMDLVQSACREVLQDLGKHDYRDEAGFRHWLFLAAERKILDRAKYHGRDKRNGLADLSPSVAEERALLEGYSGICTPSRAAAAREELERLETALGTLSDEQREVVVLSKIVGLSHAQIAERLGKTEVATRSLLHRALARLALELGAGLD